MIFVAPPTMIEIFESESAGADAAASENARAYTAAALMKVRICNVSWIEFCRIGIVMPHATFYRLSAGAPLAHILGIPESEANYKNRNPSASFRAAGRILGVNPWSRRACRAPPETRRHAHR